MIKKKSNLIVKTSIITIIITLTIFCLVSCNSSDTEQTNILNSNSFTNNQQIYDRPSTEKPLICGPDQIHELTTPEPPMIEPESVQEAPPTPEKPQYNGPTKFQVLSDIHIANNPPYCSISAYDNFSNVLSEINNFCPETSGIISTGDFTVFGDKWEYNDYWSILRNHGFGGNRNVTASGNHEFYHAGMEISYNTMINRFTENLGVEKMYYDTWLNDQHVLVLGNDQTPADWTKASYSATQLSWLEQKLAEDYAAGRTTFIAGHQCLTETVSNVKPSIPYIAEDAQIKKILAKYPNAIFFTGDTHRQFQENTNWFKIDTGGLCVHSGAVTGFNDTTGSHKLHVGYLNVTINSTRSTTIGFYDSTCGYEVSNYTYEW